METVMRNGFIIGIIVFRLIIVFFVFKKAFQTNLSQMFILGAHFFAESIVYLFTISILSNLIILRNFIALINGILLLLFIKLTFHKERKNPFLLILGITITLSSVNIICLALFQSGIATDPIILLIGDICFTSMVVIGNSWMILSALFPYLKIKSKENIEPWIKVRYLLIIIYSTAGLVTGFMTLFVPTDESVNVPFLILIFCVLILIGGEFLAWVMPTRFKNWLNRDFKYIDKSDDLTDEEILKGFG